jgi:ribosomal 30S subunit maturation factor RimM
VRGGLHIYASGSHLRSFTGKEVALAADPGMLRDQKRLRLTRVEPAQGEAKHCLFEGIADRDAAATLTNWYCLVPRQDLQAIVAGERKGGEIRLEDLWYFEILGLKVLDAPSQIEIGRVTNVEEHGRNTVITVASLSQSLEIPIDFPGWQKPDLTAQSVALTDWRTFIPE